MQSSSAIFEAFFSVLRNVSQEATVQYTLALLDEILALDPSREKDMHAPSPQHPGMLLCSLLLLAVLKPSLTNYCHKRTMTTLQLYSCQSCGRHVIDMLGRCKNSASTRSLLPVHHMFHDRDAIVFAPAIIMSVLGHF